MSNLLILQDFSKPEAPRARPDDSIRAQVEKAWQEGHDAGLAAGMEAAAQAHAEEQDRLRASLVEAVEDQAQSRQEMQAAILRGIAPLVATVIRRLVPRLAAAGLADRVAAEISSALAARPDPAPMIRCSDEALPMLRAALEGRDKQVVFQPAPDLTPLEAEIHWDDGFDSIDIRALVAFIDESLDALAPHDAAASPETRPQQERRNAG